MLGRHDDNLLTAKNEVLEHISNSQAHGSLLDEHTRSRSMKSPTSTPEMNSRGIGCSLKGISSTQSDLADIHHDSGESTDGTWMPVVDLSETCPPTIVLALVNEEF